MGFPQKYPSECHIHHIRMAHLSYCLGQAVPRNVGLLCNVVPGTFLCILGINYAMLAPQDLTGFEKLIRYCSQQLLPARTLKMDSVILFIHIQQFLHHICNELTACLFLMKGFLYFPPLRLNQMCTIQNA